MPAVESPSNLVELVQKLEVQKGEHAQITAAVTSTLEQISGLLGALLGGARPAVASAISTKAPQPKASVTKAPAARLAASPAKAGKRQKFAISGDQSILNFVRRKGNPTTAEIQAHWKSEGRGASADNSLSKLFREKKLKREPNKQGRGSRYTLA
jgi:hypothetical protein